MKKFFLDVKGENKDHYAPGINSKGMLYISSHLSINPDIGRVPEGKIEKHMNLAPHNMERVLQAAGLTWDNVVQCRVYLADIRCRDPISTIVWDF